MNKTTRDNFGSRFGVLVAMAGSAVGLGNLWRFPYLMGQNGGAAFIILYLIFVVFICIPIMMCEFIIGRHSHANAFGAFKKLAPKTYWKIGGLMAVISPILILSFYFVVGGWSIKYLFEACKFSFTTGSLNAEGMFTSFISDTYPPLTYNFLFLGLTGLVIAIGVKKGIEAFSKIMMPLLFVIIIIIAVRSLTLPGAGAGIEYLFKPDFSKVNSHTVLAALGQAFFSLSLGAGTILTYASYVSNSENIVKCSIYTAIADTLFAIIAGCAIMPAVFSFGISPSEGPGLVFVTLPNIFASLPLGGLIAILFFVSLFLAAITSAISLLEVVIAYLTEELKMGRKIAVLISFVAFFILSALCSLSLGELKDFHIFGLTFFDLCDYISANVLMTLGSLIVVSFVGWRLKEAIIVEELTNGGTISMPAWFLKGLYFLIRYIAPLVILVIFITSTISK